MFTIPCTCTSQKRKKNYYERVPLCTFKKASLTVEASVILPVILLAMVMFASVIDICRIKVEAQAQLSKQAKELSMYAYTIPELAVDGTIDLYRVETYDFPVKLFPFPPVKLAIRARVHAWIGRENKSQDPSGIPMGQAQEMVYVTDRETVYHTHKECTHLTLTILQTDANSLRALRNEDGQKYKPCEKCCENDHETKGGIYYVANTGTSYHTSLQCGSLMRTTRLIKKSETWQLDKCQRCQQIDHGK